MKVEFVDRTYDCVTIRKSVVRYQGDLKRINVIAILTDFGNKDECKQWCRDLSGGWNPVDKFWWVPLTQDNLKQLVDLSFFKGAFYAPAQATKDLILASFPGQEILDGVIFDEFSVFPEQEAHYNAMPEFTDNDRQEVPQIQAYVLVDGIKTRLVVHPSTPDDLNLDDLFSNQWRSFKRDDGSEVWACPWIDPTDSWDMGGWPDADVKGSPVSSPSAPLPTMMSIKLITTHGEPSGLQVCINSGHFFWQAKSWCSQWEGSQWIPEEKVWRVSYRDNILSSLKWIKEEVWADKARIVCSHGLLELLDTVDAKAV